MMAAWVRERVLEFIKGPPLDRPPPKTKNGHKMPIENPLVLFNDRMVTNCPIFTRIV
jgi:hypothetical protein